MLITCLILYIYGSLTGGLINVVILRDESRKDIFAVPSACPFCGYHLKLYEILPVVSYLFLGAKCRKCRHSISPMYPLIEFFCGIIPLAGYYISIITNGGWVQVLFFTLSSYFLLISLMVYVLMKRVRIDYVILSVLFGILADNQFRSLFIPEL